RRRPHQEEQEGRAWSCRRRSAPESPDRAARTARSPPAAGLHQSAKAVGSRGAQNSTRLAVSWCPSPRMAFRGDSAPPPRNAIRGLDYHFTTILGPVLLIFFLMQSPRRARIMPHTVAHIHLGNRCHDTSS